MRTSDVQRLFTVLILLMVVGCGGDSSNPTEPSGPDLADVTLALDSTVSFGRVDVEGLNPPSDKTTPDFRVLVTAEGADDFELILDHDDEGWFFNAPLHPVSPVSGGQVQIHITEGANSSAPFDLQLMALPSSPGSFAALVGTMREHLEQRAQWAGTSIDELKATPPAEVAPELLSLKLSQAYLDSDDDDRDLTDLVANIQGFLTPEDVDLLDRLFGAVDLVSLLRADVDDGDGIDPLPPAGKRSRPSKDFCINAGPAIDTAPELSIYMTRSAVAQFGADPNSEAGRTLAFGASVFTQISVMPGGGAAGKAACICGVVIAAVQGATEAVAGILPSRFVSIDFEVDKREFDEDDPGYATYSHVEVVAESTGWVADQSLSNVLVNALAAYMSAAEIGEIQGSSVLRDANLLGLGVSANVVFGETSVIEFCSEPWTVDISSPIYCTASALNHKFEVDIPTQHVTPKEAGNDQLRVAAQSTQFGGREIYDDIDMVINAIDVDVTPENIYVTELGETVMITADIRNADLQTLRWTPEWGTWDDGNSDETNGPRTRPLVTPTDADAYPFLVTVESLSRQGARNSGMPPRVGFATIHNGAQRAVRIDPQFDCIHNGETKQFTAEVSGFAEGEFTVVWAIDEGWGTIDQNGLYQAPQGGTTSDIISATIAEDEEVKDFADIEVGSCSCSLDINISGSFVWQQASSQAAYTVSDFGDLFYQFFFGFDIDGPPMISASLAGIEGNPAPAPGNTGSWRVSFVFTTETQAWVTSPLDDDAGVTLTITELTETTMVGHFSGTAVQRDQNGDISSTVNVDVDMRAGNWDGGGWPCE